MSEKLPLEIREARLNALHQGLIGDQEFPIEMLLPGGIVSGRPYPAQLTRFASRENLASIFDDAKGRLVDDGIFIHRRPDASIQLLDRDFIALTWGEGQRKRPGWLGIDRGWLRGIA